MDIRVRTLDIEVRLGYAKSLDFESCVQNQLQSDQLELNMQEKWTQQAESLHRKRKEDDKKPASDLSCVL